MTTTITPTPTTTTPTTPAADDQDAATAAFAERVFEAGIGAFELVTMYIGHRLDLYGTLQQAGQATPGELARAAGIDARYAREWLEQQATAGVIEVVADGIDGDPDARVFTLPAAHAAVLTDPDSLAYMAPFGDMIVSAGQVADEVVRVYRDGGGISFGGYGDHLRDAQSAMNRPHFLNLLATEWLPAMPDVVERLQSQPPALVADVGCGCGWSSIALARAFPHVRVHGFDLDEASIADARRNAAAEGVADRVTFEVRDAATAAPGAYDLVCMFEALHDTARPVDVLAALRAMAGPDGTVFVMDERTTDELTPGDQLERFLYSASVVHCLPVGRSGEHEHATGTVLRTATMRALADRAGFRSVEVLPVDHDFWRFYRLR
jgi:2-polyprenyl-3-methyl-5-hydroxy-6-metoxy-1,4-benzoquinol methylase